MIVLIVSTPGANRDGLFTVLPALVNVDALWNATSSSLALSLARRKRPDLVVINTEIGYQESKRTYDLLLSEYINLKIIILSEALQWRKWKTVEPPCQVLLKGFSTQQLKMAITELFPATEPDAFEAGLD